MTELLEIAEKPRVLATGFCFTECPRWRDGWLYFSDMYGRTVYRVNEAGTVEAILRVESRPGGLGWMPGGDMLISGMDEGRVLRFSNGELKVHADLTALAPGGINDMIVAPDGRAYVAKYLHGAPEGGAPIIVVEPDGSFYESEPRFLVANGMILTEDGKNLIVAESAGGKLSIVDLDANGRPLNARTFASLPPKHYADGIGGDDRNGAWVACCQGPGVVRVDGNGTMTHIIPVTGPDRFPYACTLGGEDGQTLFICTAGPYTPATMHTRSDASIEVVRVPFHQSGTP